MSQEIELLKRQIESLEEQLASCQNLSNSVDLRSGTLQVYATKKGDTEYTGVYRDLSVAHREVADDEEVWALLYRWDDAELINRSAEYHRARLWGVDVDGELVVSNALEPVARQLYAHHVKEQGPDGKPVALWYDDTVVEETAPSEEPIR